MPGDVTPLSTAGSDGTQARKGPRHAAPRKPLLTKLQMPAGKAIALAAMPTAVFLGMGLTPKLALADDKDIPFAPGPCVTRSDEPAESESPKPSESAEPSESPSEKPDPSASEPTGDKPADEPTPEATPSASESPDAKTGATAPTPTPTPSETKTTNPLDPLGVGDAIKDLLDGPDPEPTATATPSAPATTAPADEPTSSTKPTTEPSAKPSTNPVEKVDDAADTAKDAIKDAADKAGATTEELDDAVKGLDPKKDEDIPDGAKPRFPCPTADPKALAAADLEQGIPLLPDDPWILESSKLTLKGLDYKGIVEVKTGSGKVKKVLKFTASGVDIDNLHQLVVGPNGTTGHVQAGKGSTSTITNGTVTMYTEELKGNLFGLIPVTFSPQTPPPLNVPFAIFTNVKVTQAGQFGGTLTVPGLHSYFTGGTN
ncbi:hypothetical protein [Streptomyces sp. NPDC002402]